MYVRISKIRFGHLLKKMRVKAWSNLPSFGKILIKITIISMGILAIYFCNFSGEMPLPELLIRFKFGEL